MLPSQQGLPSLSLWLRTNTPFLVILWALESNTCIWGLITLSWVVDDFYEALQGANSSCGWPDCRESILDKSTSASPLLCRIIFKNCWSLKIYFFQKCRVILLGFLPEILFKKKKKKPTLYPILEDGTLVCTKDLSGLSLHSIFILELSHPMFYTGLHPEVHFFPAPFCPGWTWWLPVTSSRLWQNGQVFPWKKESWERAA